MNEPLTELHTGMRMRIQFKQEHCIRQKPASVLVYFYEPTCAFYLCSDSDVMCGANNPAVCSATGLEYNWVLQSGWAEGVKDFNHFFEVLSFEDSLGELE